MHFNSIYGLGMIAMDKIGSCSRKKDDQKTSLLYAHSKNSKFYYPIF